MSMFWNEAPRFDALPDAGPRAHHHADDDMGLRVRIHQRLLDMLNLSALERASRENLRIEIRGAVAQLLTDARAPLAQDIKDLSALTANLNANQAVVQRALNLLPPTTAVLTRTGSYGSWFNFYLCSITADISLPNGTVVPLNVHQPTNVARCNP